MKSRQLRKVQAVSDDDDEPQLALPPSSLAARNKERQKKEKQALKDRAALKEKEKPAREKKTLLSFGDEEGIDEGDEPQIEIKKQPRPSLKPASLHSLALKPDVAKPRTQISSAGMFGPVVGSIWATAGTLLFQFSIGG